jgi:hypothetical protein
VSGSGIFFTIIATGVMGVCVWLLRQLRVQGRIEQELRDAEGALRAERKANEMEKDFDEDTEAIIRKLTENPNGNGNDGVRLPIHRRKS